MMKKDFAQPIVFFRLTPISALSSARAFVNVRSFKLRIPSREVTPFLVASPFAFPSLETLDLSTCNIKGGDLERLLMRFSCLKHIVLDSCALMRSLHAVGGDAEGPSEWTALGRLCALAGAALAKEREKELKNWIEAQSENQAGVGPEQAGVGQRRRVRAGRKGLATATISLRTEDHAFSSTTPNHSTDASASSLLASLMKQKIRVLPSPPSLQGLCTSNSSNPYQLNDVEEARMKAEFAAGWTDGIAQLRVKWKRLRTSQSVSTKVRVMYISPDRALIGPDGASLSDSNPLRGLVDMGNYESQQVLRWDQLDEGQWLPPILCLAGEDCNEGSDRRHALECGHSASRATRRLAR